MYSEIKNLVPSPMRVDSAEVSGSATSLPRMYLISKSYGCIVSNNLCSLGGATEKYFDINFLEIDGLICIQPSVILIVVVF